MIFGPRDPAPHVRALANRVPGHDGYADRDGRRALDGRVREAAVARLEACAAELERRQARADRRRDASGAVAWGRLAADMRHQADRLRMSARPRADWFSGAWLDEGARCALIALDRTMFELIDVLAATSATSNPEATVAGCSALADELRGAVDRRDEVLAAPHPPDASAMRPCARAYLGDAVAVEGTRYVVTSRLHWSRGDKGLRLRDAAGELITWRQGDGPVVVFESQAMPDVRPDEPVLDARGERFELVWHDSGWERETRATARVRRGVERWLYRGVDGTWLWLQSDDAGWTTLRGTTTREDELVFD
jgi:hypothetical protein